MYFRQPGPGQGFCWFFLFSSTPSHSLFNVLLFSTTSQSCHCACSHFQFALALDKLVKMNFAIQYASLLNNQGVQFLTSGHSARAMISFHLAISAIKDLTTPMKNGLNPTTDTKPWPPLSFATEISSLALETFHATGIPNHKSAYSFSESASAVPDLQSDSSAFYTYDRGIRILVATIQDFCTVEEAACYCSSALLFNWALALHREAAVCAIGKNEEYLKDASDMYKLCISSLRLYRSCEYDNGMCEPPNPLMVASLNNLATIYYDRLEYNDCHVCMTEISQQVDVVLGLKGVLNHVKAHEVHLNTILLHPPTGAGSA